MEKKQKLKSIKKEAPSAIAGLSLLTASKIILPNEPIIQYPVVVTSGFLFSHYINRIIEEKMKIKRDLCTKDILELYEIFLKNYNDLNKQFDLDDPIEITTLYSHMLEKGHLSADKEFHFDEEDTKDISTIMGTNIIKGNGVCRHISGMLTDILQKRGIESHNLCVYHRDYKLDICELDEPEWTEEELEEWLETRLPDEEDRKMVRQHVYDLLKEGVPVKLERSPIEEKNIIARILGNHMINLVQKDGKIYYIDPSNSMYYRPSSKKDILLEYEMEIPICWNLTRLNTESKEETRKMKSRVEESLPMVSKEEERERIKRGDAIWKENQDLLEDFYEENKELYGDIKDKVLSLRKVGPYISRK